MPGLSEFKQVAVDRLIPYINNAKRHSADQVLRIASSIQEFGFLSPCVIDKDYNVIAGHGRILAAKKLGMAEVPCVFAEGLTEAQRKAYILADNRLSEFADWDMELVTSELEALQELNFDISLTGFDPPKPEEGEAYEDEFEPELPDEPRTKLGDIWQLGEHRLMCGDSTKAETVAKLANGKLVDMYLTDPPYNVNYTGDTKDKLTIMNDSMEASTFFAFLCDAFSAANGVMKPGAAFYIWHADSESSNFRGACKETGWKLRQCLIWNKSQLVLGRQDYQWKHEPCLYGWKDGAPHYFTESRTEATVIPDAEEINPKKLTKDELVELCRTLLQTRQETTVINEDKPTRSSDHPTMKPVKLMGRLVKNSSRQGEIVLDTFGGSGSSLIACEQLNRTCYTMELDPKYCDVIINRWEALTGRKAVLVNE